MATKGNTVKKNGLTKETNETLAMLRNLGDQAPSDSGQALSAAHDAIKVVDKQKLPKLMLRYGFVPKAGKNGKGRSHSAEEKKLRDDNARLQDMLDWVIVNSPLTEERIQRGIADFKAADERRAEEIRKELLAIEKRTGKKR